LGWRGWDEDALTAAEEYIDFITIAHCRGAIERELEVEFDAKSIVPRFTLLSVTSQPPVLCN
jgi:hypothetical protein